MQMLIYRDGKLDKANLVVPKLEEPLEWVPMASVFKALPALGYGCKSS
jgi:hypothetical protein